MDCKVSHQGQQQAGHFESESRVAIASLRFRREHQRSGGQHDGYAGQRPKSQIRGDLRYRPLAEHQSKQTKINDRNCTHQNSQSRYVDGFNNREEPFRVVYLGRDRQTAKPSKKMQKIQADGSLTTKSIEYTLKIAVIGKFVVSRGTMVIAVSVATGLWLQGAAYKAPRGADGKPNLNGIWQAMNTANWDVQGHAAQPGLVVALGAAGAEPGGLGVVEGDEIPYLPDAAKKKKENFDNRLTADPEIKCYMPGVPRATYMPFPFQIVQTSKYILMAYEFANATRTIYMGNAPPSPADTWMGHSAGHWEGDTLVVDVTSFNDQTWFDRAGNFHSDALHVVERYTPLSPDAIMYEATIEDPKVFTRPWKMSMPLYRRLEKNAQLMEFKCVEFVEELMYGPLRRKPVK